MKRQERAKLARAARAGRKPRFRLRFEPLEERSLLAATSVTFYAPPLTDLLEQAKHGRNIVAAGFDRMVSSLRTQIEAQVNLAASPAVPTSNVVSIVDQEIGGFEAVSKADFGRLSPRLNRLLQLQGKSLAYEIQTAQLESNDGLPVVGLAAGATLSPFLGSTINTFNIYAFSGSGVSEFQQSAYLSVQELVLSRKLWPQGTPPEEFLIRSLQVEAGLTTLINAMENPGSVYHQKGNPFTIPGPAANDAAAAVVTAEARAFQYDMQLATTQKSRISNSVMTAVARLVKQVNAARSGSNFLARLEKAADQFDAALVGRRGLFGPRGPFASVVKQPPSVPNPLMIDYADTYADLQYTEQASPSPTTYYRYVKSLTSFPKGVFLTPRLFASPSQAIAELAIDQSWFPPPNSASHMVKATLPANEVTYPGLAGPFYQGVYRRDPAPTLYPGGAIQVIVNSQDPNIVWSAPQKTGS